MVSTSSLSNRGSSSNIAVWSGSMTSNSITILNKNWTCHRLNFVACQKIAWMAPWDWLSLRRRKSISMRAKPRILSNSQLYTPFKRRTVSWKGRWKRKVCLRLKKIWVKQLWINRRNAIPSSCFSESYSIKVIIVWLELQCSITCSCKSCGELLPNQGFSTSTCTQSETSMATNNSKSSNLRGQEF